MKTCLICQKKLPTAVELGQHVRWHHKGEFYPNKHNIRLKELEATKVEVAKLRKKRSAIVEPKGVVVDSHKTLVICPCCNTLIKVEATRL